MQISKNFNDSHSWVSYFLNKNCKVILHVIHNIQENHALVKLFLRESENEMHSNGLSNEHQVLNDKLCILDAFLVLHLGKNIELFLQILDNF